MIQVLYGDEPYGIEKKKQKALSQLKVPQMNYEVRQGTFDLETKTACRTYPFMDEKKVVVFDADTLKALDTKDFKEYVKAPSESTDLLIIVRNVDQRLKLFKDLKAQGLLFPCEKLKSEKDLQTALCAEVKSRGCRITSSAMSEFIKRLNYQKEGVNLLLAMGFLETLAAVNTDISEEAVKQYVPSNEEANEFWLSSLIRDNDAENLFNQISLIPNDEDIKVLSLILKDYRVAYKLHYFKESAVGGKTVFSGFSKEQLLNGINIITDGIYSIKSGFLPKECALKTVCAKLLTI